MFLLDDILLAPMKGLTAVCRKVQEAAQEEMAGQEKAVMAALSDLYLQLDAGKLSDEDFNARECLLLDQLEACQQARSGRALETTDPTDFNDEP